MYDVRLIKILDATYQRRYLCSWFDYAGNLHCGAFLLIPSEC